MGFLGGNKPPKVRKPAPIPREVEIDPLVSSEQERARRVRGRTTLLSRGILSNDLEQQGLKTTLG